MSQINYKIILIGDSGVGKTSFFRKLCTGEFSEKNISTIGIEKKSFDLEIELNKEGAKVKEKFALSLFDTAGQEKFRAVTLNYFKGSDGIFLLYDITRKTSFEQVTVWINSIRESLGNDKNANKYAIILIGNKLDLVEEGEQDREVTEEEAKQMCDKYNMLWGGEQSIKSINKNELNSLLEEYVNEIYQIVGKKANNNQHTREIENTNKKKKKKSKCFGFLGNEF